ncbi:kinesin-like protein KIF20B [Bombyx mori]|uniref:Kinesin motor domain-containing protein n=2 Tax=Bombyx mori TaxID=7091 RepID=A0A8R1WJQ9_BOMMO|nr:kinesin-like protein KIF20B [Bombyx mori]
MYRNMMDQRYSDNETSKRDIPSFIEPRPPLIRNPFMRPKPQKGTNLLELFEEDSEIEEPELVKVYLRMKPCNEPNYIYEVRSDKSLVTSLDTTTAGHGRRTQHNVSKMYTFSRIFGAECTQKEIFEEVVKENLKKLPDGHNFTLLTYGASGSGKTYTLMGTVGAPGLVPRSLEYVFKLVDAAQHPLYRPADGGAEKLSYAEQEYELQWVKRLRHVSAPLRDKYRRMSSQLQRDLTTSTIDLSNKTKYYVWVSFVEIYNEAIYDLLSPPEKRTKLRIREDSSGNVYVKGATQAFVRSGEEAYDIMVAGKHNLVVAATGVHAHSSRSHCIFTITMVTETEGTGRWASVRLCDLAGSERARATRNTGARMQESRAINASLHVLERCLHTLRRKQRCARDALVPYRESKLTRLLGSGLSGCRGEAVSMVVTLNPAPEYAHETKHVLSLAAVAQDIQVNNTVLTTTFETSAQDSTLDSGAELMRLRTENERLHFELIQAHARNRELMASMEAHQQETAQTMKELVDEAKDLTKQFYEEQLRALRAQMDEMAEEYENNLEKVAAPPNVSPLLQNKITELMTEIAVLEEKLLEEQLARARAQNEVEHLRSCIDERDEKAFKDNASADNEDVMSVADSEPDSEEEVDPLDQSLEPTFRKDNLSKSQLGPREPARIALPGPDHTLDTSEDQTCDDSIQHSLLPITEVEFTEHNTVKTNPEECTEDTALDVTERTEGSVLSSASVVDGAGDVSAADLSTENPIDVSFNAENTNKINEFRGSYRDGREDRTIENKINTDDSMDVTNEEKEDVIETEQRKDVLEFKVPKETLVNQTIRSLKSKGSDSSLAQFERIEMATKTEEPLAAPLASPRADLGFNILKEKRNYFDDVKSEQNTIEQDKGNKVPFNDNAPSMLLNKQTVVELKKSYFEDNALDAATLDVVNTGKEKRTYFDNISVKVDNNLAHKKISELLKLEERSPSIVKEEFIEDFNRPSTMKKLMCKNLSKPIDAVMSTHKKKHDSVDIFEGFDSPAAPAASPAGIRAARVSPGLTSSTEHEINIKLEPQLSKDEPGDSSVHDKPAADVIITLTRDTDAVPADNTIDEFENLYKDVSTSRAAEFETLVSHNASRETGDHNTSGAAADDAETDLKSNLSEFERVKYNLRSKPIDTKKEKSVKIIDESEEKSEIKTRPRRARRRAPDAAPPTLADIGNLHEYPDVTPAGTGGGAGGPHVPSPEKESEENLPPMLGVQSCPSKSITRSRRKLFTPRAEPLDESAGAPGDSSERPHVPRPSYHRPRARRKL